MTFPQTPCRQTMMPLKKSPLLRGRGCSVARGWLAVGATLGATVAVTVGAALGCAHGALAATPGDPTEAPPAWIATQPLGAISDAGDETSPEMQVTLIGRSRRLAVINGEVVKVGDDYKGSTVRAIKTNKVVMDDAEKSLSMTPGVKKSAPKMAKGRKKSVVIPVDSASSKAK